jgi:hypothetical protein
MHEEFLITVYLPFCKVNFHIKWGSVLGICLRLPICLFILSTFTSHEKMYRELPIGYPIYRFYHHLSWPFYILELTSQRHVSAI